MIGKLVVRCGAAAALAVAAMAVPSAQAQEHHHRGRHLGMAHGVSPLFVLGHDAVQKELALKPDQAEKVKELVAQVHAEWSRQMQAAGGGRRGEPSASGEDGHRQFSEMRSKRADIAKNVNEKFRAKLAEILDVPQQTRLREIAIQAAGTDALRDGDVVRELGLTPAQQEQLAAVRHEYSAKFAELWNQGGRRNSGERFGKMHDLRQEELAKSIGALNPEQQQKFATMKGKPFDMAQGQHARGRHHAHTNGDKSA